MAPRRKPRKPPKPRKPGLRLYDPEAKAAREALIYRFHDGFKARAVDPMRVCHVLAEAGSLDVLLKQIRLANLAVDGPALATVTGAAVALAALARKALTIPEPVEANGTLQGLTDPECLGKLLAFLNWSEEVKKKLPDSPTWPTWAASTPPASAPASASACGSTANASSSAVPPASPSDSPSPSARLPEGSGVP